MEVEPLGEKKPIFLRAILLVAIPLLAVAAVAAYQSLRPGWRQAGPELPGFASKAMRAGFNRDVITAESCRACHAEMFAAWRGSHHAHANRPYDPALDAQAFSPAREAVAGGFASRFTLDGVKPQILTRGADGKPQVFMPEMVLAYTPLLQFLVPFESGRWQATEMAWDPKIGDWFNVYGPQGRNPGEWGSWTGRGMNWNANCAACHMTTFQKNYDTAADSYHSTWDEMGVSCMQCHQVPREHLQKPETPVPRLEWTQAQEMCATCHSRREELSLDFKAGDRYDDHYRLALPTADGLYYPDGQIRDEVFDYGSFLMSKMGGRGGVTCLDCHDPHSGAMKLPVSNNAMCMSCHATPGRNNAPVIEPVAHSHHLPESAGNRCIECHMTQTTYMERDPRRDHGFHVPDPLLTSELGIPNACNKCHDDKDAGWAQMHVKEWYGAKMERPERARARAIARAYAGDRTVLGELVSLARAQDIPAWRATLIMLAGGLGDDRQVVELARDALGHESPLVRSAAVQVLARLPDEHDRLRALLKDPVRLVRLDAEWALREQLPADDGLRRELLAYLMVSADQPAGAARLGQHAFSSGSFDEAEAWYRKAISWDALSTPLYQDLALMKNARRDAAGAMAVLDEGLQAAPGDAQIAYMKALLLAEKRDLAGAEKCLRLAVESNPRMDRAWYNLALLYAQQERLPEALDAIGKAEAADPVSPDYPYARATLHLRRRELEPARQAAEAALRINPGFEQARALLRSLPPAGQ